MAKGYLCIVLHAHLPFVRHPEYEDSLEEDWLYEAITETYLPLIQIFDGLLRDGVDFRLTLSVTPPLVSMLDDGLLQRRYRRHLEKLIELAHKEVARTASQPPLHDVAKMYLHKFKQCHRTYVDQYHCKLNEALRKFQELGVVELVTCGATHGFLPLLNLHRNAIRAQVATAMEHHVRTFGRPSRGIWNAECGYYPGLDEILRECGVRYSFVDTHGLLFADNMPRYGIFAPVYCPSGVAVFGRDPESSHSVWSAELGYPGDYRYREFYRDIGFDADFNYIKPYIHESGMRISTGVKYYKITGKKVALSDKAPYDHREALEVAAVHAGNFMFNRVQQIEYLARLMDRPPIVVSPYDAELFGHWWYEGPDFLNFLFRKIHYDQKTIELITPSEYLRRHPKNQVVTPCLSSWGDKGYCEVWLEGSNDWIYRHLHKAAERMIELANTYNHAEGLKRRALNQAARELLLAQSSDWAFIMKTKTMVDYAIRRTKEHVRNVSDIYLMIKENRIDESFINKLELKNNIFPMIDYRLYADSYVPAER